MRKGRKRPGRQKPTPFAAPPEPWLDGDGLHVALPGQRPPPEVLDRMTELYQQSVRNSPLWDTMVQQFGPDEAERILKQFQVKLHEPGV